MKIRSRLVVSFLIITIIPIFLSSVMLFVFSRIQLNTLEREYGIEDTSLTSFTNPAKFFTKATESCYKELKETSFQHRDKLEDTAYLDKLNTNLLEHGSYLLVRRSEEILYAGQDREKIRHVVKLLPKFGADGTDYDSGVYLGGDAQALVKQIDFYFEDQEKGSAFIVSDINQVLPETRFFFHEMLVSIILILILVGACLVFWIYRSIQEPILEVRKATKRIKDGDLDFEMNISSEDELGELMRDVEDMRQRLKAGVEEKLDFDRQSKELISNISHDLKTPVTAIKGYAEGIIDGVADTPEKQERYLRTIYNKADELTALINELTLYSKIDTNRIPYDFHIVSANAYFSDCAEDLSMELESKGVQFGYDDYVDPSVKIIADPEQIKRVVHNIVNNSLKYMDKHQARIHLRISDIGDDIQVEIEDNGKGIDQKDLTRIFDRFYRTDASRNSAQGGSGIGLSIVKKIVEEHGGNIWATSKLGSGTTMYFVLRKYQEVSADE